MVNNWADLHKLTVGRPLQPGGLQSFEWMGAHMSKRIEWMNFIRNDCTWALLVLGLGCTSGCC